MPFSNFRTSEDRLRFSEEQSRAWVEYSPACTKIVDLNFNLQFMSAAGVESLGIDDITEYYGKPYPFEFYPQTFRDEMSKNLIKARDTSNIVKQEAAVMDTNGNNVWFHSTIVPISESGKQIDYFMVVSIETTEQNRVRQELEQLNNELETKIHRRTLELEVANKQLHHTSETDFLTQIPNRLAFDRRLCENTATAKRNKNHLSLLMVDIDHFKHYNDKYGHDIGDNVLQHIAKIIDESLTRKTDFVARFGGEEFAVLLPETGASSALLLAEKIRENVLSQEINSGQLAKKKITVSIGVASLKADTLNPTDLFKRADKALFVAKNSGRNNCKASQT